MASWLRKIRGFLPQEIPGPLAVIYEKVAASKLSRFYRLAACDITSSLSSGKVLDVGTGPGHLLVEIKRQNPDLEVVGLDLSSKMLEIAGQLTKQSCRLVHGDILNLPFSDGEFDLVVSTLSFHHWHDQARGIRECLRVTAEGGCCWIYDLRTDVPVRAYTGLITGTKSGRLVLGWIFKFHGIKPEQYQPCTITSWLGEEAAVETEVHEGYVKVKIEKSSEKSQDSTTCSKNMSSASSETVPTQ